MSLVYWDTMLYGYWMYSNVEFGAKVDTIYQAMKARGDVLCASQFTVAELLVVPTRRRETDHIEDLIEMFDAGDIRVLPFDTKAARSFGRIRASSIVKAADAIHLACASVAGVDLFLTNDRVIQKLNVPGIQFIDGLDTSVLIK